MNLIGRSQMKTKQTNQSAIEWKEVSLGDICEVKKGNSITKNTITHGNIPVIAGGQQPAYYHNVSNRNGETLTVSGSGAYAGFVAYFDIPIFASDCSTIQVNQKQQISTRYIYLFLKSKQDSIYKLQKGIAQPHVYPKDIESIKIPIPFRNGQPDLETQKAIVSILEKAEQLKEKRKQSLKLLDEYVKSVFNEMFVGKRFEKMKGRDLFELSYGKGLSEEERDDGKYPVYGSNGVVGKHSKYLVESPGIIIGRKGSIGEVNFAKENFWPIDTTYYINPKAKFNIIFLFYLLKCYNLKLNTSTAIPGLNRNDVYSMSFIYPPLEFQQKFASIVEHVELLKEKQNKSLQEIETLFNALMQKAFNGDLVR